MARGWWWIPRRFSFLIRPSGSAEQQGQPQADGQVWKWPGAPDDDRGLRSRREDRGDGDRGQRCPLRRRPTDLLQAENQRPADVSVQLDGFGSTDVAAADALERAAALEAVGVTHVVVRPPTGPTSRVVESDERLGAEVIAKAK